MSEIDLVCLGRAGVDFYAEQVGSRLEDVGSFAKYIGGSSTNIACCSSRMGLKAALITRVGDEQMGQFIREQLQREGVDTRNVITDPHRLTAMVVLGIKDKDTFPLIFYRENCADMAISIDDVDKNLIANSKALLVTGTHLSAEGVYNTSVHALDTARAASVKTVLDIDYRPVLWGLTTKGDGETRFIADDSVTSHLQTVLDKFDLIVGTEEEIHIAGGSTNTVTALKNIRQISSAILVLKRGPYGASVYEGDIPESLDDGVTVQGVTVDVLNVLGAGDAFISGFLRGWINDEGYEQALRYANACGALVVSRHGCTPAMPTREELDYYLEHAAEIPRPDIDPELNYLHRVTTRSRHWNKLFVHAFDHRVQMQELAQSVSADQSRIPVLKSHLLAATQQVLKQRGLHGQGGILCDDTFGQDVLHEATGTDLWVGRPVETPGSRPLSFEGGRSIGSILKSWPLEQKVKCLVYYSTTDETHLRVEQEQKVAELYNACCVSGHELLLEIVPPDDSLPVGDSVARSIERLLSLGIRADWWKIPAVDRASAERIHQHVLSTTPHCSGIVVLGLGAEKEQLIQAFSVFSGLPLYRGFAVGRTIFSNPSRAWLAAEIDDEALVEQVARAYGDLIDAWPQSE